jgi:hypothetical protein
LSKAVTGRVEIRGDSGALRAALASANLNSLKPESLLEIGDSLLRFPHLSEELVSLKVDSFVAPGACVLTVRLNPSECLIRFLAAFRARDLD